MLWCTIGIRISCCSMNLRSSSCTSLVLASCTCFKCINSSSSISSQHSSLSEQGNTTCASLRLAFGSSFSASWVFISASFLLMVSNSKRTLFLLRLRLRLSALTRFERDTTFSFDLLCLDVWDVFEVRSVDEESSPSSFSDWFLAWGLFFDVEPTPFPVLKKSKLFMCRIIV